MRRILLPFLTPLLSLNPLLVLTPLLLAGCVQDSTSYYIDDRDHALTLRADQAYFWDDAVTLTLIAARLPECQRQFVLTKVPLEELALELFSAGDQLYNLRAGSETWQIDTRTCTQGATPDGKALGQPLGTFRLTEEGKLAFERAQAGPAPAPR
ncbi:MAG: hypothetical protein ACLGI6_12770 [Gammaproteobacteria bacterium]